MIRLLSTFVLAIFAKEKHRCSADSRQGQCSAITDFVTFTNSWTCRSCFNIRVNYKFDSVGTPNFEAQDSLILAFKKSVLLVKFAHPVRNITNMGEDENGNHLWKVSFVESVQFGDSRMDFNAEFREIGGPHALDYGYSCPCKNKGKIIIGDTTNKPDDNSDDKPEEEPEDESEDESQEDEEEPEEEEESFVSEHSPGEACGSIITADWDYKIKDGKWNCKAHHTNAKAVRCQLYCNDGYNTRSVSLCRLNLKSELYLKWSQPKRTTPTCQNCSIPKLRKQFPVQNGGKWECSFKDGVSKNEDRDETYRNTIRMCHVTCPSGTYSKATVQCRQNKGWKLRNGSKEEKKTQTVSCI